MWTEVIWAVLILWGLWEIFKKPSDLPPGVWGLPLIGHVSNPPFPNEAKIKKLRDKYGDIFVVRIGTSVNLFLCRYDLCKKTMGSMEYTNRPEWLFFNVLGHEGSMGLLGNNGRGWLHGRRFALRHLHALGMGRTSMTDAIQMEARIVNKRFATVAGELSDLDDFMNQAVVNIVWKLVANRRYNANDEEAVEFYGLVHNDQEVLNLLFLIDFIPWITKIMPYSLQNKIFGYEKLEQLRVQMKAYLQGIIDDHKVSLDPAKPRDYIDAYLLEIEKYKDDPESTFREADLLAVIWDLFIAGSETVAYTVRWFLLYMTKYPKVQKKVQAEIDAAMPRDQQPSWEDRDKMPYTEATMNEILRMTSLTSAGLQHCTTEDTMLNGYRIPKGTIVYPVTFLMHNDEQYWDNPSEFRPERFLTNNKFVKPLDGFMPFGVGRRLCLGESLARMEVFIFTTTFLQKFFFSPGPDGINLQPKDVSVLNLPRSQKVRVDFR